MKTLPLLLALFLSTSYFAHYAHALPVFNLNVFDQLQGKWESGFREKRLAAVGKYIGETDPEIVVFQEARGVLPGSQRGGADSVDADSFGASYRHRKYVHEMTGADGASYGYWIGAKSKPREWIEDGFAFPGGVERKVIAGIWDNAIGGKCLGVIGLHMSYQNTQVRQKEARWILEWVRKHEKDCAQWLVVGDFNADQNDTEMRILFEGGLKNLYRELKPTVGAFNPIRRIYGDNIPSRTIDWALGWNLRGSADVVLDRPFAGEWVSDHAGISIFLEK
jgi:endonuclease/exonuclease/phosphatase family metal-dependent hydrolase